MIFLDMRPINKPEVFLPGAGNLFDANGNLTDGATEERLTELLTALAAWSKKLALNKRKRCPLGSAFEFHIVELLSGRRLLGEQLTNMVAISRH